MRVLSRLNRNKSALSNIVAYVLLISITVALSVIVYGWLRFYVTPEDIDTCSEDVNVIIRSYQCFLPGPDGTGGRIYVTLKNKGLFTIDGYELRVHDRDGADFGIYLFDDKGFEIKPGEERSKTYWFNESLQDGVVLRKVTLVEVQPFIVEDEGIQKGSIRCKSYASQEVVCR